MIEVICVVCGYETMVFAEEDEPCPHCGASEKRKLDQLFEDHPIPIIEGSPGLVRKSERNEKIRDDMSEILGLAVDHGVVEDV